MVKQLLHYTRIMVLLIRRIWTGSILVVIMAVLMAGEPSILSADAQTYLSFIVGAIWAPVAFLLTMVQQATGKGVVTSADTKTSKA